MKTALNYVFILLLLWSLLLEQNAITSQKLASELGRQLEQFNKYVVVTIQTRHGDTYDCVDFYKQPAFDHPSLHNRKFDLKEMNFAFEDLEGRVTDSSSFRSKLSGIWLNDEGCPIGTVPIRKISKTNLLKANLTASVAPDLNPRVHVALLRSTGEKKYYGGGMYTTVYNPIVRENQYSASRMKLQNGPDSIAVGWMVNPSLYQDKQARIFIYTKTTDSHCYNTFCPGFVITNHDIPLDLALTPISERGKSLYEQNFFIRKHPTTGDWFLMIGRYIRILGFWPKEIFTELADFANYAEWGGEVYNPDPDGVTPPQMGSGQFPVENLIEDGLARLVLAVNENYEYDYNPSDCEAYADDEGYKVIDKGDVGPKFHRLVLFGGDGSHP
ncbi:unnamed protein product [Linum trigynum]|uniref:Neprosin PEP catalytic domain-containing protein n=1 Tax=Linum trigynum TaxID=586398 RepID=A0AAV2ED61_9ROSI